MIDVNEAFIAENCAIVDLGGSDGKITLELIISVKKIKTFFDNHTGNAKSQH